jgi:hypothetical protein
MSHATTALTEAQITVLLDPPTGTTGAASPLVLIMHKLRNLTI